MRRYMTAPNASTAENTALTRYQYALDVCRTARADHTRLNTAETKRALDATVAEVRAAESACA